MRRRPLQPSRRELLQVGLSGLSLISFASTMPAFLTRFARAESATQPNLSNDNILVVVQLSGGNDGLNTVIPVRDDAYFKARPKIAIKDHALKLSEDFALNPVMTGFKDLFDKGHLAVINGCGYPQPNRSHFRSMEIWQTANPKTFESCGWLGHYIDHCLKGTDAKVEGAVAASPLRAVNLGSELPRTLVAESAPVPSINSIDDFRLKFDNNGDAKAVDQVVRNLNAVQEQTPALQFLSRQATNAVVSGDQVRKLAAGYKPDAQYPRGGLGSHLQLIAQLINANLGTRLFYTQTGGFDNHANQVGSHENALRAVSESIAAFLKDLAAKGLDKKVTVMCFSEFGRRVKQNDSNGTDHGAAGPMFLLGPKIKPGLHGDHPSLTTLDNGDLKHTTDFRTVYAAILKSWLNADPAKVIPNGPFTPLELFA